ncbi:MAG: hypothetical protein J6T10_14700 [Methanobrevibacter sp.]|nr:hypothetical protein [Methanobrevibacter sp.]
MRQKDSNGGSQNTKSKKSDSKLVIVGNTPNQTQYIKDTIEYLENIVINKDTIGELDTYKLITEINKLIQYVEVLSVFKKPAMRLFNRYKKALRLMKNNSISSEKRKELKKEIEILDLILKDCVNEDVDVTRKEYWQDYE